MTTANDPTPTAVEPAPPASSASIAPPPATAPVPQPTTDHKDNSESPSAPPEEPKMSTSTETPPKSPPFSPNSTTPVLEKEELDFSGNVNVNDDIPTEKELKRAGDLLVLDSKGVSRPFKDLYSGEGVAPKQLIIFVRHFFCGNCQEYLRTLSSSITPDELIALPTPAFITVIGCGKPELIDMYVKETNCPFPVYADPTRKLYDYLGMTRTWDLGKKPSYIQTNLVTTSMQSIVQSLKTGNKALKGGDFKQVGGEFLFEDGAPIWVHRMRNTRDHSEVEQVRQLFGLSPKKPPLRKRWSHSIKADKTKGERTKSSTWGHRLRAKSKGARDEAVKQNGTTEAKGEQDMALNGSPTV